MITVEQLCTEMERIGRHLTPRAARDWWTKGLLPRPRRRGLGRGMGTETFWVYCGIVEQACAADDLLSGGSPAFVALIGLWLWGFPVDLHLVRESYAKLIDYHLRRLQSSTKLIDPDETVGKLAAKLAPTLLRTGSPQDIKDSTIDLLLEILTIFYGSTDYPLIGGLADLLTKVSPFLHATMQPQNGRDEGFESFIEEHFESLIDHLQNFGALPRQQGAMNLATDYELTRARRIVRFAFGSLIRLSPSALRGEIAELGRRLAIVFGRLAVPILVGVLREPLGRQIVPSLLRLAVMLKRASKNESLTTDA